jgi:hypothetical protein
MMPLVAGYGDLDRDANFALLVNDVCRLVELNPVTWEGVNFDRGDIARRCRSRSVVALFGAVYDVYAAAHGARAWVCKSLENVQFLAEIEAYFPDAQYLYLYRDGRDVAVSFRKVVVGQKHFYHIAKEWAQAQRLALRHRATVPARRFASIRYEDLIANPAGALRGMCELLGVQYDDRTLEFYKSEEAKRTARSSAVWSNVVKPIMADNTRKFLREASEEDITIFESIAGDVLDALGYERAFVARGKERKFTPAEVQHFDAENRRLKDAAVRGTDSDDIKRRDRQDALLAEIAARQRPERLRRVEGPFEGILQSKSPAGMGDTAHGKK